MQIKVGTGEDGNSAYIPSESSGNSLFTDQAMQAALLGSCQNLRRRSDIVANLFDVKEESMIAREMEKRRIREEILAAEQLLRRRDLEAEVLREIMMEREIFTRRRAGVGLPSEDSLLLRPEGQLQRVPVLGRRDGFGFGFGIGIGERPMAGLSRQEGRSDGTLSLVSQQEGGGGVLGGCLLQRQPGAAAANGIAVKPILDLSNGQQLLSLVKPMNSSVVGIKRKFEASIAESGYDAPSFNLGKEIQKEWSCALCHVTTTCELGLKDHLKGRKHKAKMKALQTTSKTMNNNANNSKALAEETEKADLERTSGGAEESEKQTNSDFRFWCTLCKIGTTSEALMTAHRRGKKHMASLQKNGGGVIAIKTMPENTQYISKTNDAEAEGQGESPSNAGAKADSARTDQKEDAEAEGKEESLCDAGGAEADSVGTDEKEDCSRW